MEKRENATKETPSSIKGLLNDFCGYTTAHGLGRLSESRGIFSRLLWSLFCIGATTMFILQVYNLLIIYLSRPVSTVVQVEHESHVFFPAVTICNMNMVRIEKVPESFIQEILEHLTGEENVTLPSDFDSNATDSSASNATDSSASVNATNYDHPNESSGDYDEEFEDEYFGDSTSSEKEVKELEYQIEEAIRAQVALENDSSLFEMGHQFDDFVFECSFRGYDCRNYTRYWRRFWDYRYGNCYTFNGGISDSDETQKVLSSYNTGPTGGLKLNLFIEQSQYIREISHTAGARVVIHDQGQMPFPDSEGHNVLPSRSTSFGMRRTVIERVDPFENGSCVNQGDIEQNIYSKKYHTSYSRQACLNSCFAERQVVECACAEAQFPADADVCNKKNSTIAKCLEALLRKLLRGELKCESECPTPCRENIYRASLSMGEWPSYGYEEILASRVKQRSVYTSEQNYGYYLSENFLQIRIFFEQLNYERVVEKVTYKTVNLVADIGGQLGLWIGISVLTCCELLELMLLIMRSAFRRLSRTNVIQIQPGLS